MKRKALAWILALCLVLTLLPAGAAAAEREALPFQSEPTMDLNALPQLPAEPAAGAHTITMTQSGQGTAELYATSANAGESVYFLADPEPGYAVSFENCRYYSTNVTMELYYIGLNMYEIVMPDGNVILDLVFEKIPTSNHDVTVSIAEGGSAVVSQSQAKKGESLFVEITPADGYSLSYVGAKYSGGYAEGYDLGLMNGVHLYEIFMPDDDLEIVIEFTRNGPYPVSLYIDSEPDGGTVELSHTEAYEAETVTITAHPDPGYRVKTVACFHSAVTAGVENQWTFQMPNYPEEVHVTFEAIPYPLSVTVETGLGGTAALSAETATVGQTVTLTCTPEEGYRVARITGADDITDNGDNTYTFLMPAEAVELSVLFLREGNPFLDVNETHFFHDSVMWAVENGITNGIDETHFGPFSVCNRAQVVTFLWRAAGSPEPSSTEIPFSDVAADTWYTDAVLWAVENGITNGMGDGTFGTNRVCNRAQVVTFLHRSKGSPAPDTTENPFTDVADDQFYYNAVLWALENGITTGATATTFNPNGECQRAHVVTFLYRAAQLPEAEPLPFPGV